MPRYHYTILWQWQVWSIFMVINHGFALVTTLQSWRYDLVIYGTKTLQYNPKDYSNPQDLTLVVMLERNRTMSWKKNQACCSAASLTVLVLTTHCSASSSCNSWPERASIKHIHTLQTQNPHTHAAHRTHPVSACTPTQWHERDHEMNKRYERKM